jgi:hypothetical protein
MELKQFAELVAVMRRHQKDYFRSRNSLHLEASKRAEREVDAAIIKINEAHPLDALGAGLTQQTLF